MAQIPSPHLSVTVAEAREFLSRTLKEFADQGRVDNSGIMIVALQSLLDGIPDDVLILDILTVVGEVRHG